MANKWNRENRLTPRPPTDAECDELQAYHESLKLDAETAEGYVQEACIAVWDCYCSDGPGYSGKVMTVIYAGAPEFTETFYWTQGKMVKAEIE